MPRPLIRAQIEQNERFLAALRETGNARLAARELGLKISTLIWRRERHPGFAAAWADAAQAAHARFALGGGVRRPDAAGASQPRPARGGRGGRTRGGELHVVRVTRSGRLQVRRSIRGRMTAQAEQIFLQALAASANVKLAAAVSGFSEAAFYKRRRLNRAFAIQMETALGIAYDRLEAVAVQAATAAMRREGATEAWIERAADTPLPLMN